MLGLKILIKACNTILEMILRKLFCATIVSNHIVSPIVNRES